MVPATYSATAMSAARNEAVVLMRTPSMSKKMVSKQGGNWRSGRLQITEVRIQRPFTTYRGVMTCIYGLSHFNRNRKCGGSPCGCQVPTYHINCVSPR